jgi:hypothetical protein
LFVCCQFCVLSGRGLCDKLITRPEESYRLWCVVVCDLETSRMWSQWPTWGRRATVKISHRQKKMLFNKNCVFYFLCNVCLEHFAFQLEISEIWSKKYICLHIKCPLFLVRF